MISTLRAALEDLTVCGGGLDLNLDMDPGPDGASGQPVITAPPDLAHRVPAGEEDDAQRQRYPAEEQAGRIQGGWGRKGKGVCGGRAIPPQTAEGEVCARRGGGGPRAHPIGHHALTHTPRRPKPNTPSLSAPPLLPSERGLPPSSCHPRPPPVPASRHISGVACDEQQLTP